MDKMRRKIAPGVTSAQETKISNSNNAVFGDKCFADAECDESPSAGWQFVKYCMRC